MYPGDHLEDHPDKPAVVMGRSGVAVTYAELDCRSTQLARLLREAGLSRGDHIAIFTENQPRYLEIVWAALDCPGGFAWGVTQDNTPSVLGRMAARLVRMPAVEERCIAVGWRLEKEGRKRYAGTAVFTEAGDLCGLSRQTWIQLNRPV